MYVCGMTVYDFCHIGHARVMIVFDMVVRWLRASGYEVLYVRNITDIDDKIINRALENGEPIAALTNRFIDAMHADSDELGLMHPDQEPRATDYIKQMQGMIGRLIENELAYQAEDGDVNFAVRLLPRYGQLSGKTLDELNAGERVAVGGGKRDPLDFVLWKSAKPEEPADTRWSSPWGEGRPGWHIECSAMSTEFLGSPFDIHTGGVDLKFPHHENELAQCGGTQANFYLHNEHLSIDSEKMSKSLGNIKTIRNVKNPLAYRYLVLSGHYRSQMDFSMSDIDSASDRLSNIGKYIDQVMLARQGILEPKDSTGAVDKFNKEFKEALEDDLNTPKALAAFTLLEGKVYTEDAKEAIRLFDNVFGLQLVFDTPLHDTILVEIDK